MNLRRIPLEALAKQLTGLLPGINIHAGDNLCWSPNSKSITYRRHDTSDENIWGVLHEAGHARLDHASYNSDIELLQLEVAAWDEAVRLAREVQIKIDYEHIQDCLDTYRDWLHQRSTCPRCGIVSLQVTSSQYKCHNCQKTWTVSASRLCRPYRLSSGVTKKNRRGTTPQAVFQAKNLY